MRLLLHPLNIYDVLKHVNKQQRIYLLLQGVSMREIPLLRHLAQGFWGCLIYAKTFWWMKPSQRLIQANYINFWKFFNTVHFNIMIPKRDKYFTFSKLGLWRNLSVCGNTTLNVENELYSFWSTSINILSFLLFFYFI